MISSRKQYIIIEYNFIVTITLHTIEWAIEITWSIVEEETRTAVCTGQPLGTYGSNRFYDHICTLEKDKERYFRFKNQIYQKNTFNVVNKR